MSEITLLGLGSMGNAIGQAMLENKFSLTVWNRSPDKANNLLERGAELANSLEDAIDASPRIMICITEYETTMKLLAQSGVLSRLTGKTIIQLSTGTPGAVREMAGLVKSCGADYLDGSIMVYPETIGGSAAQVLISGDRLVYLDCAPYLNCLGGDLRYVGDNIVAATTLDLAVLSRLCMITPGVVNGARICEAEGVSLKEFAELFPEGDRARSVVMSIHDESYRGEVSASVNTAVSCLSSIKNHADELGINNEVPSFAINLYQRALARDMGDCDTASLIEIIRDNSY